MKIAIVHIADIHFMKNEPEGVSKILNAFFDDLTLQKQKLEEYSVFLGVTGDIVFSGNDSESYKAIFDELNNKLNSIGITRDYRITVPGNHDLDREILKNDLKEIRKNIEEITTTEKKFNDSYDKENSFNNKFENYECFESDFAKYGIDFNIAGKGHTINEEIGVFCLNTALCSLGGINNIDDKKKLAIYSRGLVDWCRNTSTKLNILLMHHSLNNLINWSETELKQIIESNFILVLCGQKKRIN